MTAVTATSFDGTDLGAGTAAIQTLGIVAGDNVVYYRTGGNTVVVMRVPTN